MENPRVDEKGLALWGLPGGVGVGMSSPLFGGVFSLAHQFLRSEPSDLPTGNRRLVVKVLGAK